jgi:acyl-CoA synthetase (AMP-forming)/AMP-acid ligase II
VTLDQIVRRNGLRFPDRTALAMDDYELSWRDLDRRVDRLSDALLDAGLNSGDRAAILLGNRPEYFELYFACARSGVIAVPINFRLTPAETAEILDTAGPSLLVLGAEYIPIAEAVRELMPGLDRLWVIGDGSLEGAESYETMLESAAPQPVEARGADTDTLAIFFTSGTTGLPKGALVSHLNLEANGYNQFVADGSRRDDINLVATPIYHMGAVFMAVTYMMLGCTQVILPAFAPVPWLETLQRWRATTSLLIPTMINAVLNEPRVSEFDVSSLRLIFYGGGPMPPAVLERALEAFHCDFTQGYGLTETLEATFLVAEDHRVDGNDAKRRRLASAGREAVGADVRIVGDDGSDLPSGEIGEVLIRSRSVISGYWNNPEETAAAIRDGWFCTGDLGYLDEERYLFIVDRKKDMVISGGVNIYTKEVETVLYRHPAVREAAVFGLPDDEWGEIVTAAVSLRAGQAVGENELIDFCKGCLASFKKPKRVVFLDELPKNPSGKILKRELRRDLVGA